MSRKGISSTEEVADLLRKLIIIELFRGDVPQSEIAKRLSISINTVNAFLKNFKKS